MDDRDRVDLSALDAANDSRRWEAVVAATLARVDVVIAARGPDPLTLIASWSKPLTLAALAAIAVLVPIEIMLEQREAEVEKVERLVELSTESAVGQRQPTGADLLRIIATEGLQ
ncbi:MAG: hypothetical protein WD766_06460 [Gemmatimonadota bacterium]